MTKWLPTLPQLTRKVAQAEKMSGKMAWHEVC